MVRSQALMPALWMVQDISSAFEWTAPSLPLSKGKLFLRKKMPKRMTSSTKKFLSPPEARGACSPPKASPSLREELQPLEQPALELLSGHLCANQA